MCFTTNKLQPINLQGNIFDISKSTRPLTIQDYIHILIDNDKYVDSELANMINNIQSLTARYRRLNDHEKSQGDVSGRMKNFRFIF
jgi:ABC-type antimicrobial peptide transport system ATPase subunit